MQTAEGMSNEHSTSILVLDREKKNYEPLDVAFTKRENYTESLCRWNEEWNRKGHLLQTKN